MKKRLLAVAIGAMLTSGCSSTPLGAVCYIPADTAGQCQIVLQPTPKPVPILRGPRS